VQARLAGAVQHHFPELVLTMGVSTDSIHQLMAKLGGVPVFDSRTHYELGDRILGGSHEIQRATNTITIASSGGSCDVVLKRFALADAASRKTFERELRVLARLRHPNVVELTGVVYVTR
jgi:hypothetical protein